LLIVWLLLSGHYEPLTLTFGVISCVLVVILTQRMDVVDREGHPVHLSWSALIYWPWLLWEIAKANVDVARRVLSPSLPISPTMIRVKTSQLTDLGRVIYANSITLTPGTISLDVRGGEILVHALSREGADELASGEMDRRVTRMEGEDGG
jgi:multicomponent Na+:H+ antiporter subunit E